VPEEYAKKFDQENPSDYGTTSWQRPVHDPERLEREAHRLRADEEHHARAQPELGSEDRLPAAYLDKIIVKEGVDPDVGSRQIVDGQNLFNGDFTPPPAISSRSRRRRRTSSC
jgi:hypothetical protein